MVRPTDQETTATENTVCHSVPKRRRYAISWGSTRATWGRTRVSEGVEGAGKCGSEPLLWFPRGRGGEVGETGLGLASLNDLSRLCGVRGWPQALG